MTARRQKSEKVFLILKKIQVKNLKMTSRVIKFIINQDKFKLCERSIDVIISKLDKINAIAERLTRLENAVSALQYPSLGRKGPLPLLREMSEFQDSG